VRRKQCSGDVPALTTPPVAMRLQQQETDDEEEPAREAQIIGALREQERDVTTAEVCGRHRVSGQTLYRWKASTAGWARRAHLNWRKNSTQKVSASKAPIAMPSTSRRPLLLTAIAMVTATETVRPASRTST
jgi:Transposase